MQTAPSVDLVSNLPTQAQLQQLALADVSPLIELLDAPLDTPAALAPETARSSPLAIHSHVNRLLSRIARPAGVEEELTSHSFRRGGAQHANGSTALSDRWIFDRGGWNISTTNKAFNYVFNTRTEDHKVSKVLSGWKPTEHVPLGDLKSFDDQRLEQIAAVQKLLFASCTRLSSSRFCVSSRTLDVLFAQVLLHYPRMRELHPRSPIVLRLEQCALEGQCSLAQLLSWSSQTADARSVPVQEPSATTEDGNEKAESEEQKVIRHQAAVISHLVGLAKQQNDRLDALERLTAGEAPANRKRSSTTGDPDTEPTKRRQRAPATALSATWFEWYCREPRLWSARDEKQHKSDSKLVVAYMKLFVQKLALNESDSSYRNDVMVVGAQAERSTLNFLEQLSITARGSQSVLKRMRALHKTGSLNELIVAYKRRFASGAFVDPAPRYTLDVLEAVVQPQSQSQFSTSLSS